jgi:hypothetical protein
MREPASEKISARSAARLQRRNTNARFSISSGISARLLRFQERRFSNRRRERYGWEAVIPCSNFAGLIKLASVFHTVML